MKSLTLTAVSLLAVVGFSTAGDVTGKISLKGTPPPEKPLPLDPACGKTRGDFGMEAAKTRFYVTKDGGLGDVFVYVKSGLSSKPAVPSAPTVIDQKGCEYTPYVAGAMVGQKIAVKNSDPVLHNVHPTPTVAGNKEYNKAQLPKGPDLEFSWDNAEIMLRFKCDVHPWMFAYVGVVDSPYHAVSNPDGSYKIAGLPAGKYVIEAFHRKSGKPVTKEITVTADGGKADFTIEVPAQ